MTVGSEKPTLAVFMKVGGQNAADVKLQMDRLKKEYATKASLVKVDASFDRDTLEKYKISKFPTWIVFKNNQEIWRGEGEQTVEVLIKGLKEAL